MPPVRGGLVLAILLAVGVFTSVVMVVSARWRPDERATATPAAVPPLDVPSPRPEARPRSERFVGVVLPNATVDLVAQLTGEVVAMPVEMGGSVGKGRVLAVLRSSTITEADIAIARADLRSAEADAQHLALQLEQARERLARAQLLNERQLITGEQLADAGYQERLAMTVLNAAQATVEQKRAVVQQREEQLSHLEIRAPFDGTVSMRYVERGSTVGSGTPLFRFVQTLPLKVRFAVPGTAAHRLQLGGPIEALLVDRDLALRGTIGSIAAEVDSASQMVVVEAALTGTSDPAVGDPKLLAGRSANVTLVDAARDGR